jgi:hypothetical protein
MCRVSANSKYLRNKNIVAEPPPILGVGTMLQTDGRIALLVANYELTPYIPVKNEIIKIKTS